MNELKPVVIFKGVRHNSRTEIWGFLSSPDVAPQANTDLYAIPDTHRVVSVELLRKIEMFADGAQSHYSAMNDEVCQSYSEPWQQALIIMGLVGDIIDNKEQKE